MISFTKEQNDILAAQAAEILKSIVEGQTTRDILAWIYVEGLDDKTIKQGQIMADSILGSVKAFASDYKEAQENLDRYLRRFQETIDVGKTCMERCNYWLKFGAAISAATVALDEDGADREAILQEIEELEISENEATPEYEKELREQAMEAIRNSGVMLGALAEHAAAFEEITSADEAAGILIDLGNKEIEYRAIVAMLAYIKIKSGEFDNVPVEMTAAQVTTLVCAEIEQAKIMEAVGKGDLAVDIASGLLSILGIMVLATIAYKVIEVGTAAIIAVFGIILSIPATLMLIVGVLQAMGKASDLWDKESRKIVKGVFIVAKTVVNGLKAVVSYARERIVPELAASCKTIRDKIKDIYGEKKVETQVTVG